MFGKRRANALAMVAGSDESEPSWLEPELELVTFFPSARNQKLAENEPKF